MLNTVEPLENDHPRDREKWAFQRVCRELAVVEIMWGCNMTPVFMLIAACQYVTHSRYINKNSWLPRRGGSKLGIGEHPGDDEKSEKTHLYSLFPIPGVSRVLPLFLLPQPPNYLPARSVQRERGIWRTWRRKKQNRHEPKRNRD